MKTKKRESKQNRLEHTDPRILSLLLQGEGGSVGAPGPVGPMVSHSFGVQSAAETQVVAGLAGAAAIWDVPWCPAHLHPFCWCPPGKDVLAETAAAL